jgi:hypothetical protein
MFDIDEKQGPEGVSSDDSERVSQSQSSDANHGRPGASVDAERGEQPPIAKRGGPKSLCGKNRSKYNALQHGLFSKHVRLPGESRAEYGSLLSALIDDYQPIGKLETLEVEYLATLLWRRRRIMQVERAEILKEIEFMDSDISVSRCAEAWDRSRTAIVSGGLLRPSNNPRILKESIGVMKELITQISKSGFREDSGLVKTLYGEDWQAHRLGSEGVSGLHRGYDNFRQSSNRRLGSGGRDDGSRGREEARIQTGRGGHSKCRGVRSAASPGLAHKQRN